MTTKEKIIRESLHLFAANGFDGVSVRDIAFAVGIKDSSLYKHFAGKKKILETIVLTMAEKMDGLTEVLGLPRILEDQEKMNPTNITEEEMVTIGKKAFLFYLKDEFASDFRRLLSQEQYHDQEIAKIYRKIFLEDSITYQSQLFAFLFKNKILENLDTDIMALHFYAPIFYFLNRYDNQPEKEEEALISLEKHIRMFYHLYVKQIFVESDGKSR